MPRGDRTGPEGYGPRTGRALGYCSGYDSPGYTKGIPRGGRGYGRGFGRGLGWRRGWGRGYYPARDPAYPAEPYQPISKDEEKQYLKDTITTLENELNSVKKRLQELSDTKKEETP